MKPVGPQEVVSRRKRCESDKNRMFTMVEARALAVRALYDLEKII